MDAAARKFEDDIYATVAKEIAQGIQVDGILAKAVAHSGGDQDLTRSLYIQYRVQAIRDDMELEQARRLESLRQEAAAAERKERERIAERVNQLSNKEPASGHMPMWVLGLAAAAFIFIVMQLARHYR